MDIVTTTITTTTPGNLLVGANLSTLFWTGGGIEIEPGVICDPHGACGLTFGVYLDGIPVPGAARSVSAAAGLSAFVPAIMLQGIASNVPAGTHAVALRYQWTSGTGGDDVYYPGAQVQAIAVG